MKQLNYLQKADAILTKMEMFEDPNDLAFVLGVFACCLPDSVEDVAIREALCGNDKKRNLWFARGVALAADYEEVGDGA